MASLDVLHGPSPSDFPSALAVLAGSLYLPDIAAAINLAVACGHPALLAAACRAIDRIVGQQPAASPEQILALMIAAITLEGALSKQRPTTI